jgi:Protein of unknown function (DUF4231)
MLETGPAARSVGSNLATRRQLALDRVQELIARAEQRAARAWRNYYTLQILTIGLAAITPCLIFLAKDNPQNELLNWLQLFFPAVAAICAGATHIFRWREDGVGYTELAENIRSELWKYQTRSGGCGPSLTDDQALDYLVMHVDDLNLKAVSRWATAALADTTAPAPTRAGAPADST